MSGGGRFVWLRDVLFVERLLEHVGLGRRSAFSLSVEIGCEMTRLVSVFIDLCTSGRGSISTSRYAAKSLSAATDLAQT